MKSLVWFICLMAYETFMGYQMPKFDRNNFHTLTWFQVFITNINNLYMIIWFQATIPI